MSIRSLLKSTLKSLSAQSNMPAERELPPPRVSAKILYSEPTIELYDHIIRNRRPLLCGLYPPEVVLIYYCEQYQKFSKNMREKDFQQFWLYDYGIEKVKPMLVSLQKMGFIEEGVCKKGKNKGYRCYRATDAGLSVIRYYDGVVWAHKHNFDPNCPAGVWAIGYKIEEKRKIKPNYPYRDIVWQYLSRLYTQLTKKAVLYTEASKREGDPTEKMLLYIRASNYRSDFRFIAQEMADFLYEEERFGAALQHYNEVAKFDILDGVSAAPEVLKRIELCKKNMCNKTKSRISASSNPQNYT